MVGLVGTLFRLFHSYGQAGALEAIAIKAATLLCALISQKPHSRTSKHDLTSCLQRCLSLWIQDNIDALLDDGHTIQHRLLSLSSCHKRLDDDHHISRRFVEHVIHENVKTALNLLNTSEHSGVPLILHSPVSPDDSTWLVLDELRRNSRKTCFFKGFTSSTIP